MATIQRKLTNDNRATIVSNLVSALFDERDAAAKKVESELATKVLVWHIGDKNLALMKQLPAEFFASSDGINVQSAEIGPNREKAHLRSIEGLRIPEILQYRNVNLPPKDALWEEIRTVATEKQTIYNERLEVESKVKGLLAGVSTVKRLLETWPEVEQYLPAFEEKKNLPAVQATELNDMIRKLVKK